MKALTFCITSILVFASSSFASQVNILDYDFDPDLGGYLECWPPYGSYDPDGYELFATVNGDTMDTEVTGSGYLQFTIYYGVAYDLPNDSTCIVEITHEDVPALIIEFQFELPADDNFSHYASECDGFMNGDHTPDDYYPETCFEAPDADDWYALGGSGQQQCRIDVLSESSSQIELFYTIPGFTSDDVVIGDSTYQDLGLVKNIATLSDTCKPAFPVLHSLLQIPATVSVSVEITSTDSCQYDSMLIFPLQPSYVAGDSIPDFSVDEVFYSDSTLYPNWNGRADTPAVWRSIRVVDIEFLPLQI